MKKYEQTIQTVLPLDRALEPKVRAHLDDLTKPQGSLGQLEEMALRYCLIQGAHRPRLGNKRICCFAGDHGVADEGVSAYPKEVTLQMALNMLAGGAAINVLTRHVGADLVVVDMGIAEVYGRKELKGKGNRMKEDMPTWLSALNEQVEEMRGYL